MNSYRTLMIRDLDTLKISVDILLYIHYNTFICPTKVIDAT